MYASYTLLKDFFLLHVLIAKIDFVIVYTEIVIKQATRWESCIGVFNEAKKCSVELHSRQMPVSMVRKATLLFFHLFL